MKVSFTMSKYSIRFVCNKTKDKRHYCRYLCRYFWRVLKEHKEDCFIINGKQSVKLRGGSIKFKSHFKQLSVPFKV